ncbi:MAG: hydrogenase iron-sulfur subunit, partial [Kiritimatiellae bacterium]|nr:hydrogenase iron-sulfur subunit [Kiritimatiellia bacterium]
RRQRQMCIRDRFRSVRGNERITLHLNRTISGIRASNRQLIVTICPSNDSDETRHDTFDLDAEAMVLATGFSPYAPHENPAWGYGRIPNIVTGVEAEEMIARHTFLARPSDGRHPQSLAFVQCVGSRTTEVFRRPEDTNYCSTVCCPYALRTARHILHRKPETEITIFFMDIQNFGKKFQAFYDELDGKLRLVRARPYELTGTDDGRVCIRYAPDGRAALPTPILEEFFDMVVLSVGIRPAPESQTLADIVGIPTNESGFFATDSLDRSVIHHNRIFAVGACEGPRDIADCLAQAEVVALAVYRQLHSLPICVVQSSPAPVPLETAPSSRRVEAICPDVAVAGAGVGAVRTALTLADLGHRVLFLAPESPQSFQPFSRSLVLSLDKQMAEHEHIQRFEAARILRVVGQLGRFAVQFETNGRQVEHVVGAVVLADQGLQKPVVPPYPVIRIEQLWMEIADGQPLRKVAFIMDTQAEQAAVTTAGVLSAAERLLRRGAQVRLFCNHIRVSGDGLECLYLRCRQMGLVAVKGCSPHVEIGPRGKPVVTYFDSIAGKNLVEEFDRVALADMGTDAALVLDVAQRITGLRPVPTDGLQADSIWLLPVLTNRPGIFVVDGARGPCDYHREERDALAAAFQIHKLLGSGQIEVPGNSPRVNRDRCALCLTCLRICPHGAVSISREDEAAFISPLACQRCGICVAECPADAIELPARDEGRATQQEGNRLIVFACQNSAVPAMEQLFAEGALPSSRVELIPVPCAGRLEPRMILETLRDGSGNVLVLGCHPESCQYLTGASRAARRFERLAALLAAAGFDPTRVRFGVLASVESPRLMEFLKTAGLPLGSGDMAWLGFRD